MKLRWIVSLVALLGVIAEIGRPDFDVRAQSAQHAYFDALDARRDRWHSYSLRDPAQLTYPRSGGMAASNDTALGLWVTYDPASDTERYKQDAAKITIPTFFGGLPLSAPLTASATVITFAKMSTNYVVGRSVKVDSEIMVITERDLINNLIRVDRAQHGTSASAHAAGATVLLSNNSLPNQVRLPLGTSDGNVYLFTWDAYWTDSYVPSGLKSHKAFQFSSKGDGIWLEPRARYDGGSACCETPGAFDPLGDVAAVDIRAYLNVGGTATWLTETLLGPGATSKEPLAPKTGTFVIKPNRWTRFWMRIDQRANDYDYLDYWVADETRGPVRIHANMPVSVLSKDGVSSIDKFWLEFNTSQYTYRGSPRNLVSYVRNFVALRNPGDPTGLLVRPVPGLVPDSSALPAPPTGLRIVS